MSSREAILGKIRGQLSLTKTEDEIDARGANVRARIRDKKTGVLPKIATSSISSLTTQFKKEAVAIASSVNVCTKAKVSEEISTYLKKNKLPPNFRIGDDSRIKALVSKLDKNAQILVGVSDGKDLVCVSHAEYGAAETGTLALVSGSQNPTTNNFLATHHIVLLKQKTIVAYYEDIWKNLRRKYKGKKFPRTVNLISGPSRSGDIEQKIIMGAHGPTNLHIIIYKS